MRKYSLWGRGSLSSISPPPRNYALGLNLCVRVFSTRVIRIPAERHVVDDNRQINFISNSPFSFGPYGKIPLSDFFTLNPKETFDICNDCRDRTTCWHFADRRRPTIIFYL